MQRSDLCHPCGGPQKGGSIEIVVSSEREREGRDLSASVMTTHRLPDLKVCRAAPFTSMILPSDRMMNTVTNSHSRQ